MSSPSSDLVPTPADVAAAVDRLTMYVTGAPFDCGTVRVRVDDLRTVLAAAAVAGPVPGVAIVTRPDGAVHVTRQTDPRDVDVTAGVTAAGTALQGHPVYGNLFSGDPQALAGLAGFVIGHAFPALVADQYLASVAP